MSVKLVVIGCGGFGREVFSLVEAINAAYGLRWTVAGFVDDAPSDEDRARVQALGSRVLGPVASLADDRLAPAAVLAIGSPTARAAVHERLRGHDLQFPFLIHPAASVGQAVTFAEGVVIGAGARISTNITFGVHVHVDQNATIGHDTSVGDYSRLNPQACVSGSVQIATHVLVGANATILPSLRVGSRATVGAQACVVRDVAAGTVVKGIPAR